MKRRGLGDLVGGILTSKSERLRKEEESVAAIELLNESLRAREMELAALRENGVQLQVQVEALRGSLSEREQQAHAVKHEAVQEANRLLATIAQRDAELKLLKEQHQESVRAVSKLKASLTTSEQLIEQLRQESERHAGRISRMAARVRLLRRELESVRNSPLLRAAKILLEGFSSWRAFIEVVARLWSLRQLPVVLSLEDICAGRAPFSAPVFLRSDAGESGREGAASSARSLVLSGSHAADGAVALTNEPIWLEVPLDEVDAGHLRARLKCSADPAGCGRHALVQVRYCDKQGEPLRGIQAMSCGPAVGDYQYLSTYASGADLHLLPPPGAATLKLGFQAWQASHPIEIENTVQWTPYRLGVSVVIPTYKGSATVLECLESLREQTLDAAMFEIVIVINGPRDNTLTLIQAFIRENSGLNIKLLVVDEPGVGNARNIGVLAAERQFVTFIDDDDYVSPGYLDGLLSEASADAISITGIYDVAEDGVRDNPINKQVVAARELPAVNQHVVSSVLTLNACKIVPTAMIRRVPYHLPLRSGEDVVCWTELFVRFQPKIKVVPESRGSIYFRRLRPNSVSRQAMSFDFYVSQRLDVIRRLDVLLVLAKSRGLDSFVTSKMRAQADFIVRYLLDNAGDYQRFIDIINKDSFSYDVRGYVNSRLSKRLVISYCFPPYIDTAGVVAAKRVRQAGVPVDVIQNSMKKSRKVDGRLMELAGGYIGAVTELNLPESFSNWKIMADFSASALKAIERRESTRGAYAEVYSRALWPASNFAAAAYKAINPAVNWTAEFSDPLLLDIHGKPRPGDIDRAWLVETGLQDLLLERGIRLPEQNLLFFWCELLPYALADKLVFTNENQREYMLGYCEDKELASLAREKSEISPHPTMPPELYGRADPEYGLDEGVIHIGYFGAFYATRGLGQVFQALASVDKVVRERIRLHIFTQQQDEVQGHPLYEILGASLVVNPYVGYFDFLALTRKFDCLIVNDAETVGAKSLNPYLPSKLSDYMGSGSPIWAIYEPGSALDRVGQRSGGGITYRNAMGDVDAYIAVLESLKKKDVGDRTPGSGAV